MKEAFNKYQSQQRDKNSKTEISIPQKLTQVWGIRF